MAIPLGRLSLPGLGFPNSSDLALITTTTTTTGFYELLNPDLSGRPLKAPESTLSRRLFKSLDAFMFDLDQAH